jgi:hypothetical protein
MTLLRAAMACPSVCQDESTGVEHRARDHSRTGWGGRLLVAVPQMAELP